MRLNKKALKLIALKNYSGAIYQTFQKVNLLETLALTHPTVFNITAMCI